MVSADTSFLISLYGQDVNTPSASQHAARHSGPIHLHAFNDYEFANALRLLVFRQKITPASRRSQMQAYEKDKKAGKLQFQTLDANAALTRAEALSTKHTETGGNRAYDILQVAAAKMIGATEFWSFDGKQRLLATAEGMLVGP